MKNRQSVKRRGQARKQAEIQISQISFDAFLAEWNESETEYADDYVTAA